MYFVWKQCLPNSNFTVLKNLLLVHQLCSNRAQSFKAVYKSFHQKCVYMNIYIPI